MANVKNYGLSGISTVVEFGKQGQKLSSAARDGGGLNFGIYEKNGTTLANLLVANGSLDQDAVAFKQMNDAISTAIGRLTAGLVYKGPFDASAVGAKFPTPIVGGDFWKVSGAGTIDGLELAIGDMIIANNTQATGDTSASDFDKIDNTEAADILRDADISDAEDLSTTDTGLLTTRGRIATWVASQISAAGTTALVGTVSTRTVALTVASDASVDIGVAIPANARIIKAIVNVDTPFNVGALSTEPTVSLGYTGSTAAIAAATEIDLTTAGTYDVTAFVTNVAATLYKATYAVASVPHASPAGAATIVLEYINA